MLTIAVALLCFGATARAQDTAVSGRCATPDTIVFRGAERTGDATVRNESGLVPGPVNYRTLERAIKAIYATGQFDDVIVFHPLSREHISQIVSVLLKDVRKRLAEDDLTIKLTPAATELLVKNGYDEAYGARPLKRSIQKYIEDPLSEKILLGEFSRGDEIEVDASADGSKLDFRVLSSASKA
jgi:hypothetical protein